MALHDGLCVMPVTIGHTFLSFHFLHDHLLVLLFPYVVRISTRTAWNMIAPDTSGPIESMMNPGGSLTFRMNDICKLGLRLLLDSPTK